MGYEGKNNVIPTGFDVNAAIDAAATESTTFIDVVVEETVAKVAEERKDEVAADAGATVEKNLETKLDETFETADYLQDMDRYEGKNNVIPTGFDVNAAIDAAATESTTFIDVVVEETVAKVAEERKRSCG